MAGDFRENEKRHAPRVKVHTPLRYQIRGRPEFNHAVSDDLGAGGMSFVIDIFIAPSSNVGLQINVLSRSLNPIGRVKWIVPVSRSDKYRLGLEFVEFDPTEKRFLHDYMDMQTGKI